MQGQEKLSTLLKSYSLVELYHTILLLGDYGCGKHTLVKELASHYNIELIDITENISLDYINEIYLRAVPTMYLIDTTLINEKKQNVLLKMLEEPSKYAYIVLIGENKSSLINTILNRCVIFEFENYSRDFLKTFISDKTNEDFILKVCNTPGQIKLFNSKSLKELDELCQKIVDKISVANFYNTMTISKKFNYKDEFDKFDIRAFFNILLNKLFTLYINNNEIYYLNLYNIVNKYKSAMKDTRLNKEYLIESMLIELWKCRG